MKNIIAIAALTGAATLSGFAQGEIEFQNSTAAKISVNSVIGGAATSTTSAGANLYYYALFNSVTSPTVNSSSAAVIPTAIGVPGAYAFSDTGWTFDASGASTSKTGIFSSTTLDTAGFTQIPGEPASSYFVVVGWSANIGSTVQSVKTWLAGGDGALAGFIGQSTVSGFFPTGTAGTGNAPQILFGQTPPAIAGFTLGTYTPTPEPGSVALGVMGGLSLLALRRKKA